jgi:hypothetical protein
MSKKKDNKKCPICNESATDLCGTNAGFIKTCGSYECKEMVFNHASVIINMGKQK